jgi:hypothetical protein
MLAAEPQRQGRRNHMKTVTHNPTEGVYLPVGDYVHALEVRNPERLLFVAGPLASTPRARPAGRSPSSSS